LNKQSLLAAIFAQWDGLSRQWDVKQTRVNQPL
jgi:hypothetical protein